MKRLFLLAALCAAGLNAQLLSFGVVGGAPFTDVVNSYNSNTLTALPKSTNFIVGPSFQVNLPLSLRIEVDALYRPYSFSTTGTLGVPVVGSILSGTPGTGALVTLPNVSANDWNFPVLMQYRFKTPVVKPFVEAGFAVDHLSNLSAAATAIASGPGQLEHQTSVGVVLGGGVDVKIPFVRFSGELRYTRYGSADFQQISNLNQAEFLLGVHF
jgi:hypothetical protein